MCDNCKEKKVIVIPPIFQDKNVFFIKENYLSFKPVLEEYANKTILPYIFLLRESNGNVKYVINLVVYNKKTKKIEKLLKRISFNQFLGLEKEAEFFRKLSNRDYTFAIVNVPDFTEKVLKAIRSLLSTSKKSTESLSILVSGMNYVEPSDDEPCIAGCICTYCDVCCD